jgi:hypothetical protein
VSRRLLFDQNLAPRLVDRVAEEFPGSLHVRDLDLLPHMSLWVAAFADNLNWHDIA